MTPLFLLFMPDDVPSRVAPAGRTLPSTSATYGVLNGWTRATVLLLLEALEDFSRAGILNSRSARKWMEMDNVGCSESPLVWNDEEVSQKSQNF